MLGVVFFPINIEQNFRQFLDRTPTRNKKEVKKKNIYIYICEKNRAKVIDKNKDLTLTRDELHAYLIKVQEISS